MADVLVTILLGWYGFGLVAALVLAGTQLAGRVRRRRRAPRVAGSAGAAEPVHPGSGGSAAAPSHGSASGGSARRVPDPDDVGAERRRAG